MQVNKIKEQSVHGQCRVLFIIEREIENVQMSNIDEGLIR